MIHENEYVTQLVVNNILYSGPSIKAKSWSEAERYIEKNGMSYLTIVGELKFSLYTFELN